MKKILLQNTKNYALVDDDEYDNIIAFGAWYETDSGYAIKKTKRNGKNLSIRMHTLVNNTPIGLHTDHINGNRLDNRKANLRSVSAAVNSWNRHKDKDHRVYQDLPKGMSFDKSRNQYVATRTLRRRFNTMEEAVNFINSGVDEL
jgi:hypothetical protein